VRSGDSVSFDARVLRPTVDAQIGQFLQRKVTAAASAAVSARGRAREEATDGDGGDDEVVEPLIVAATACLQIPPRPSSSSTTPMAVARPSRAPKHVIVSTGTEQVHLEIKAAERPDVLDRNLRDLLAQQQLLPAGQVRACLPKFSPRIFSGSLAGWPLSMVAVCKPLPLTIYC
jgi:hypothetical protein